MNALAKLFLIVTYILGIALAVAKLAWYWALFAFLIPLISWVIVALYCLGSL